MKRLLSALAIFVLLGGAAHAQHLTSVRLSRALQSPGLDGRWEGAIETPEGSLCRASSASSPLATGRRR